MSLHNFPNIKKPTELDGGGSGGDNGGMDSRLARIEAIIPTLATKEDVMRVASDVLRLEAKMHQEFNSQTWKFVTWMTGICTVLGTSLVGATYFIAHNAK